MQEQPLSSTSPPQSSVSADPFSTSAASTAVPIAPPIPTQAALESGAPEFVESASSEEAALTAARNSGAGWFYWIAALTLVNTVMTISGSDSSFGLGLGLTVMVDAIAGEIIQGSPNTGGVIRVFEFGFDALAIGLTALWGVLGGKGHNWAMLTGAILLALDTLLLGGLSILAGGGMWISIAIHIWALVCIFGGWNAGRKLKKLQQAKAVNAGSPWAATQAVNP